MPLNLIKVYNALLELEHLGEAQRKASLMGIFKRDIEDNPAFLFRTKQIRPLKIEADAMQTLFTHLTCKTEEIIEGGRKFKRRIFEFDRSKRLHWIRHHTEERQPNGVNIFSLEERVNGRNAIRTYIHDTIQHYVIVLEPQRSNRDYYFLTAHYLNDAWARDAMYKRYAKRLPDVL